jgi:PAS domain S-box-containing protein
MMLICMGNLLAASGERVYFKDLRSRFLSVSEGWIAAYAPGSTAEDLAGKTDFDVFSDQHASTAFDDEQQIIRTGQPIVGKVERETFDGRGDAWVSTTKMPLRDAAGAIIGTFGISRDVTAQVRAEEALARQARQLRLQNEAMRELDRQKDEFIGLVSHELRTPLTSIIGYAELLLDERARGLDSGQFLAVIERNAHRLMRLVGDLLFLSGISSGQLSMEFRSADLAEVAAYAVAQQRPEALRKHIDLRLSATDVPRFTFDPVRASQLLDNLLSNAVKFTPDGGRVEVRLGVDGDRAVLAVADTGIGIADTDRRRVFERFFRTATVTRQAIPGTGLGLAISKAIVEAHQGTITVDSEEGRGSTFKIRLPLRPAGAAAARLRQRVPRPAVPSPPPSTAPGRPARQRPPALGPAALTASGPKNTVLIHEIPKVTIWSQVAGPGRSKREGNHYAAPYDQVPRPLLSGLPAGAGLVPGLRPGRRRHRHGVTLVAVRPRAGDRPCLPQAPVGRPARHQPPGARPRGPDLRPDAGPEHQLVRLRRRQHRQPHLQHRHRPLDRAVGHLHLDHRARGLLGRYRRVHQRLGGAGRHAGRVLRRPRVLLQLVGDVPHQRHPGGRLVGRRR